MIFNLGSAKVCSPAKIETYFSYDKDIWIAVTDDYLCFFLVVPFLLVAMLQFINFPASCRHLLSETLFSLLTLFGPFINDTIGCEINK